MFDKIKRPALIVAAGLLLCFSLENAASAAKGFDTRTLPELMKTAGFVPPKHFRAVVYAVTFTRNRKSIAREKKYLYNPAAFDSTGWNAASTVKLYAAAAAVRYIRSLGFTPSATLTFHGPSELRTRLDALIEQAVTPSDNLAYNRLVQFVGFGRMNKEFLSKANGFTSTALARAYGGGAWTSLGESPSLRISPPITIRQAGRVKELPSRKGTFQPGCSGTCTTLRDLSTMLRKLMLQEQLRPRDHFGINANDLIMIRKAMRADRKRGEEAVNILRGIFKDPSIRIYHKGGYVPQWYSDNIYISMPQQRKAYMITMAACEGRNGLDTAARILGRLILDGTI